MTEKRTLFFVFVLLGAILLHVFNKDVKSPIGGIGAASGLAGL